MNSLTKFLLGVVGRAPCPDHRLKSYRYTDAQHRTFEVTHCASCRMVQTREVKEAAPRSCRRVG